MSWYDYLAHPASVFAAWKGAPPFGMAEALLLLLSLLWGLTGAELIALQGTRRLRSSLKPDWSSLFGFPVIAHVLWISDSFITLGILRSLHIGTSFETIFSVLVIGGSPTFLVWIGLVLSGAGYLVRRCWQAASCLLLLWSAWLLWTGLRVECHLNGWHAAVAALPLVLPLWGIGVYLVLRQSPETFQSCCPWRRKPGERVVVFYNGNKAKHEVEEIVKGTDETLRPGYCYQHAHALAGYPISRYGLPRYFELCREVAASEEPTEGRKLAAAVEKIYGSPLLQVERAWRKTWPQTWRTGQTEFDFGCDAELE